MINNLLLELLTNIKDKIIIIEGSTINKEFINMIDKDKYNLIYINLTLSTKDLIKRYKLKEKIRKSNWINNLSIIKEIDKYLKKDNLNIINNNTDKSLERIIKYVKKNLCL